MPVTTFPRFAPVALLCGFLLACGSGSPSTPVVAPPYTVTAAALTLPVPPVANQSSNPTPYSGTVTLTLNRTATFTGAVTLSVDPSKLPLGVKADFAQPVIGAAASTAVLSIQAGSPDPKDSTFATQIYPPLGSYAIPIVATSGSTSVTSSLTLNLTVEPADFGLLFTDSQGSTDQDQTNFSLAANSSLQTYFMAYWATGTYTSYAPVSVAVLDLPAHLGVTLGNPSLTLNTPTQLTVTPQQGLQAGTYTFTLSASFLGVTHSHPVVITYNLAPFALRMSPGSTVTVAQGHSLTLPAYLWHDDAYFGTVEPSSGDPSYVGSTNLGISGVLANTPQVAFTQTDPTGLAVAPLTVSARPVRAALGLNGSTGPLAAP